MGSVDGVTGHNGSFHVWGWALDPDQPSTAIAIHVYIYPQGSTNPVKGYNATVANLNRPDLKSDDPNSIGARYGTVHGFDCWIDVTSEVPAGTYDVRVWPINVGSSEGNHTITYSGNGGEVKTITISNPYTVSYNANGGTGAPSAQRKVTSINITLSSTTPTRTGYTFNGWNTASNGSGTNYAKGATYSANASATLYAKWTANKYTVTLNQQSGSGGSSSVQATYDANMPSMTKPSRTGYTFQGYYDATSGGTQYYKADGSSARTWNKANAATLYARWTANTYTITLDPQGGTGGDGSKTATFGFATPTVNIPGRNGYSFGGYYTGKNGTGTQYLKPDANNTATSVRNWDIASNTTLYAKWNARTYALTFDQQGGNGGTVSTTATFDAAMPAATMPTRAGYTFKGYYDAATEGTLYYNADGSSAHVWNKTAVATLYARWEIINYTVAYNLDGGEVAVANPTEYTVETETFTLNNPTKEHNDFLGWTGSNGETPQTEVSIAKGSTGNKTYTANWLLHTFAVETDESMAADWSLTPASPVGVGQTLTATYSGTKRVKSVSYFKVPVVTAPTPKLGMIYTGEAQELVNAGTTTGGTMQYKVNEGEWSTSVPSAINAGTYTVYYRVQADETYAGNAGGSFDVTITKATAVLTAPTAKTNLTYNTKTQELVNAGSTTAGTLQYKVNTGEWSTAVPSATNAGTYAVYYRVAGDDNYADIAEASFNVTIAKATPAAVTLSKTSISFGADDFTTTFTVTRTGDGAISVSSSNSEVKCTLSGNTVTVRRRSGRPLSDITITVSVAESANYLAPANKTCSYSHSALRTPANIQAKDKGCFLGAYGYLWPKDYATDIVEPLQAVVAYVGSCDKYFDKCLCIALEDISNTRLSRADAATAVNTWASSHSVNVGGTVYSSDAGGYYDFASPSNYKIRDWAVAKGWRIPTVCDWRYIMNAYKGSSLTNPAGVNHSVNPNLCKWSELRTAINNATGGTAMKTDNNYGSSTRDDGNSNIGTWHVGSGDGGSATWWWANDHDGYKYYYRAVFAY